MERTAPPQKRGPRGKGRDPVFALRIPPDLSRDLDAWGAEHGFSRSAAIRGFIEAGIGRQPTQQPISAGTPKRL